MHGVESSKEERKLAAIMFTDLVGFTSMAQKDESLAMAILSEHAQVVRSMLQRYGGREIKTMGDSFLIEFPNALDAVRYAVEVQEENSKLNSSRPSEKRASIRIGIHVGDVIHSKGDVFGDAVNIASRIEALAGPGGICITEQVYDQVRNKVRFRMTKLPSPKLKNVNLPIDVYVLGNPLDDGVAERVEFDRARVAVLPLTNMSPDPNDEYFADGMTEELITALSGIKGLTVIARTSVMPYKKAPKRVAEIGRELEVGTVIEGSVRKAGNKVRITVQVIDARNEGHLWASNYDRELNDIFAVQSEIAEKVAGTLKVRLLDSDRLRLAKSPTGNVEAHTLYLKGRYYWNLRTKEGMDRAIEYFKLAVEQDEGFAAGYTGLAQCYLVMGRNLLADPAVAFPKAKEYVSKALELDPNSAEAHACRGNSLHYYEHRLKESEAEFRRAIELNPNYATAHQWFAHMLVQTGRRNEAFAEITRARELDPLSRIINLNVGDAFYYLGEYDKAIEQFRKLIDLDPEFALSYRSLAQSYALKSEFDEALAAAEKYGELSKKPLETTLDKALIYAWKQDGTESHRLLAEAEANYGKEFLSPFWFGAVYCVLGEDDRCFEWLNRAYNEHDPSIMLLNIEPYLERVRGDPRFLALLKKVGLSEVSS
ncbi:MAG: tetratricopeptide repeat protein [Thaumarchaeota archaeon]|nr:tetratricopeptide repeat protein [Nitrososphaerota archaeon]